MTVDEGDEGRSDSPLGSIRVKLMNALLATLFTLFRVFSICFMLGAPSVLLIVLKSDVPTIVAGLLLRMMSSVLRAVTSDFGSSAVSGYSGKCGDSDSGGSVKVVKSDDECGDGSSDVCPDGGYECCVAAASYDVTYDGAEYWWEEGVGTGASGASE